MVTYDYIMLGILAAAVAWGLYKGMVWQLASCASIVASYFVSIYGRAQVADSLGLEPPWGPIVAMLGIYLFSSMIIWLIFAVINKTLDGLALKDWDRQIGAGMGLIKGLLLCIIVTMFAVALTKDESRQQIVQSKSGFYITKVIHNLHSVMPEEVNQVVEPYIIRYNQRVNGENPEWFAEVETNSGTTSSGDFGIKDQLNDFSNDVQNQVQNRIQNEVQNQVGEFQNFVQGSIDNPQNLQSNWQQYSGQFQQPQQPVVPQYQPPQYPQMNIPQPQQPNYQQPQSFQPPQQYGQPQYPQYNQGYQQPGGYYPPQPTGPYNGR